MNKKNNKTIISIISIIVALVICFFGYTLYQKKQVETVSAEKLTALHELTKKFNDENDRNKRLELLKDTLDEQSKYNLSSNKDSKVQDEFKNSINTMRTYFHNDYDNTLKKYTISDISSTSDNNKINDSKSKLDELTKIIEKEKDYTFETEKEAQEKQTEIEKLVKKYEERISELGKKEKEIEKRKEDTSVNIGEQSVKMTSTHYENEYFIVDVPEKWSGKWWISKTIDTKDLGTSSQPAIVYSFSRQGDNPMFGGGGQTVHVYPNGLPTNKIKSVKEWTKFGSNIYVGAGASSGFFNEKNQSIYREEMARIKAK
ncbi:hypothetical protein [uncultured Gemella sp.]|uniref:hypothetical protein n=1 Tax=uncultured Gemella sp. TaxID=254352 RepID=UPI0028E4AEFE|nr:hypothetical protein [uncultured Gemella sp.]